MAAHPPGAIHKDRHAKTPIEYVLAKIGDLHGRFRQLKIANARLAETPKDPMGRRVLVDLGVLGVLGVGSPPRPHCVQCHYP
jgi:hypothetical protein